MALSFQRWYRRLKKEAKKHNIRENILDQKLNMWHDYWKFKIMPEDAFYDQYCELKNKGKNDENNHSI